MATSGREYGSSETSGPYGAAGAGGVAERYSTPFVVSSFVGRDPTGGVSTITCPVDPARHADSRAPRAFLLAAAGPIYAIAVPRGGGFLPPAAAARSRPASLPSASASTAWYSTSRAPFTIAGFAGPPDSKDLPVRWLLLLHAAVPVDACGHSVVRRTGG